MLREFYSDSISTTKQAISENINHGFGSKSLFKTDITLVDYIGEKIVSVKKHRPNMTVLGGRLDVIEKSFGIIPDETQRLLLSDMIPAPTGISSFLSMEDEGSYATLHKNNTIFSENNRFKNQTKYFCIGNGGEDPDKPYTILNVKDWETRLYNMVPFRCVPTSADLSTAERSKYRLRKTITIGTSTYYAYYLKVIDPGVVHSMNSGTDYKPSIEDSEPYIGSGTMIDGANHSMKGHTSEVYISFDLEISTVEFKEFYRLTHTSDDNTSGSLTGARLTELGLVSGLEGPSGDSSVTEVYDPVLFAKLTHEPVFLSTEGSRRQVTYSIYA